MVGVTIAIMVVGTFAVWALLGELVGPEWAIAIMGFATACGLGAAAFDYMTEPKEDA
jgi:hypothetical protein